MTKEDVVDDKTEVTDDETKVVEQEVEGVMTSIIKNSPTPPEIESIVEGPVISIDKAAIYIDLPPHGTGIIYGREYINARDIIRKINLGDTIAAKVVDINNPDGYTELSLKEARQAIIWGEAEKAIADKLTFDLPIKEANRGGLIIEWQGVQGFLPASQLKMEHYPRVENGDKDRILEELKRLVGERLSVSIIAANPVEDKLIFSEKDPGKKEKLQIIEKYSIGDELEGQITGVVDFGIFVKVEEGLEGLVHISEIDWALVDNPRTLYNVEDKVKVKVIDVKDGKISLSIKALKKNPWETATDKYKKGEIVKGVVIKFNQYGALVSIEDGVAGLVHVSEFGSEEKLKEKLELGNPYTFQITFFEPKEQKMTLSFLDEKAKTAE